MKHFLIAGLVMLATPALAQTTSIPDTALSTSSSPSTGPRSQEANLPSNSAASANTGTMTPDAPLASYPICEAGQFDNCMEPGNHGGRTKAKRMKRPR